MAAVSVAALAFSGVEILMVHPRLYWGEAGNDLTPPLLELPISRNYRHGGWTVPTPLLDRPGAPVSAGRTFEIFNENGWGRSHPRSRPNTLAAVSCSEYPAYQL